MEQRLQKILAAAGLGSRRHCETIIASGRVTVNNQVISELGAKADPDKDDIRVDGRQIRPIEEKVCIILNKPVGYTTTRRDPHAKHTIMELLPDNYQHLHPVGRLDVDTSGLLLLTNDGELTQLLTHPSHRVEKTYVAEVEGKISAQNLRKLENGVELEDGLTAPARVRLISYSIGTNISKVEIIIHEGRKRQVRRMFMAVGHKVVKLSRIRLGNLNIKGLNEGEFRVLTARELAELRKQALKKSK